MALSEENIRLIFGLKLREQRQKKNLSLFGLSKKTGLSKSYLNEIEKGKKYPKTDKILLLSDALETPYEDLISLQLTGKLAPVGAILDSGILKEIPLDLFGIDEGALIDMLANAPTRFSAFLNTVIELGRSVNFSKENFYLTALRSYQEANLNYFPEIEFAAEDFIQRFGYNSEWEIKDLCELLEEEFNYEVDLEFIPTGEMKRLRALYVPGKKPRFHVADNMPAEQQQFLIMKEIGFAYLGLRVRPTTFSWIKFDNFDEVLNNFKASYFAGAVLIPREPFANDLKDFMRSKDVDLGALRTIMTKYTDSSETFFQRMTNILPGEIGLSDMFFLRFAEGSGASKFKLNKELHLTQSHRPHENQFDEHYCRRWVSLDILENPYRYEGDDQLRFGVQISEYPSGEQYLIIAARNADPLDPKKVRSVCVGIGLTSTQKRKISFLDTVPKQYVNVTCENCAIKDCAERAAQPVRLDKERRNQRLLEEIELFISS